ncbi:ABZJ_00895 family protein [Leisingera daeponensis]|uniref:ABZJ_00895 family protein n=1 Tax=Leisingera daeponensis TaxID=405746 RepID=A0ABS7NHD6_9RHOB|nr:ABZJ_00895 family protein [Leisingera daeponensis]MBY6140623.1 ABZJ_00895 family protein [Leisingera daeponensis]
MQVNLIRYALWWMGASVAMLLAGLLLAQFGLGMPAGLATVLPPMVASVAEGMRIAQVTRAPLPGRDAWTCAAAMTGVVAVLTVIQLPFYWNSPMVIEARQTIPFVYLAGIFLLLLSVILMVNRLFLGHGIKLGLKRLEE